MAACSDAPAGLRGVVVSMSAVLAGSVLMSLKCKAGATDRLRLGRGRHLLKLRTPNDLLYNVTIRANAKFMAGGGAAVRPDSL